MGQNSLKICAVKVFAGLWAAAALTAQSAQVVSVSPQGEVAQIRQVVVKFDESAVNFGDPKAEAPATLNCSDAQVSKGTGRWVTDRVWSYDFENDLPPGVRCTLQMKAGLKTPAGPGITSAGSYQFNSGGPFVQVLRPYQGNRIDEEQFFTLQLNGAATLASVQANVWCTVEGLGERIDIRLLTGKERDGLLTAQGLELAADKEPTEIS